MSVTVSLPRVLTSLVIDSPMVKLRTTHGDLKLEIFCESVPKTAENFLALCASGAYDGTPFHRLIPNFMAQGGDTSLSALNNHVHPVPKGGTLDLGLVLRGRDSDTGITTQRPRGSEYGEQRTGHEWEPVLHYVQRGRTSGWEEYCVWEGH